LSLEISDKEVWAGYAENPSTEYRDRIVKRYIPLVKYVVGKMKVSPPRGLEHDDLVSFGVFGLLDAVEKFDLSKGFSFTTFAIPRIRGAVLDELRKFDWISRTGREKLQKFYNATGKVLQDKGHISDESVMQEMGVDEKAYRETLILTGRNYIVSLNDILPLEDGDVEIGETIADDKESIASIVEYQDEIDHVKTVLAQLSEREIQVISFYYYEDLTLKEISRIFGISESRVSQIHTKAIATLRHLLKNQTATG
jgi:RNA polymerase sigma factor for flagellar operon FliA